MKRKRPEPEEAKERIVKTAKVMLAEASDIEKITVRDIAERAGVGVGLIN